MCLPVSLATSHLRLRSQLTLPSRGFVHQDHRISKDIVRERERGHHKFSVEAAEEMDTIFPMFCFLRCLVY